MNRLITIGLLINAACIVTDRFIVKIPSMIAIPLLAVGIISLVIGSVQMKRKSMT